MTKLTSSAEQAFLDDLDKKLWNAADRLRSNLDAAVYKHAVLGLIFLKYVSDAFDLRREELEASLRDSKNDCSSRHSDLKRTFCPSPLIFADVSFPVCATAPRRRAAP